MTAVAEGDRITYNTPDARYQGVALHVAAGRVIAALAVVQTDRRTGVEVDVVGRESSIPVVLPVAAVEVIA
jgi:hypothetical protein